MARDQQGIELRPTSCFALQVARIVTGLALAGTLVGCNGEIEMGYADAGTPGTVADAGNGPHMDATPGTADATPVSTPDATVTPPDAAPSACLAIAPAASAATNRSMIQSCLNSEGLAILSGGTYPLDTGLNAPASSQLRAATGKTATLQLTGSAQYVVRVLDQTEVGNLRLDVNHQLGIPHGGGILIAGSSAQVHDLEIYDSKGPTGTHTGVRFSTVTGINNQVTRVEIHDLHYGVIFDLYPGNTGNRISNSTIRNNRCDSLTFRGYGEAVGNTIYHNGWDCQNGPIPGGGIYTLGNDAGALIEDNHVYENCGMSLDLDDASKLAVRGNLFEKPDYRFGGAQPHCGGGMTAHLIDVRNSTIENNTFVNSTGSTVGSDSNNVMGLSANAFPSDLPATSNTSVAFLLTNRRGYPGRTVGNTIKGNIFIASCAAPCLGLGYFAGRGTGFDAQGQWSATSTNYYTGNAPNGSNYGSKRCGGNWYAASATCPADPSCNTDDTQHEGAGHDWSRNDACAKY